MYLYRFIVYTFRVFIEPRIEFRRYSIIIRRYRCPFYFIFHDILQNNKMFSTFSWRTYTISIKYYLISYSHDGIRFFCRFCAALICKPYPKPRKQLSFKRIYNVYTGPTIKNYIFKYRVIFCLHFIDETQDKSET